MWNPVPLCVSYPRWFYDDGRRIRKKYFNLFGPEIMQFKVILRGFGMMSESYDYWHMWKTLDQIKELDYDLYTQLKPYGVIK